MHTETVMVNGSELKIGDRMLILDHHSSHPFHAADVEDRSDFIYTLG